MSSKKQSNPSSSTISASSSSSSSSSWNKSLLSKLRTPPHLLTKSDILDLAHTIKQLIALLLGLIFGTTRVTGIVAVIAFAILSPVASLLYFRWFKDDIDVEYLCGSATSVPMEGMMNALALFLLSWILTYSITMSMVAG